MFICSFSESAIWNVLFISRYSYIVPLPMARMQFWPNDPSFRSFEVIWGHIRFMRLTFDRIEIERWGWSQYLSFAQTHRLICNVTYLSRQVTSRDLDLRSNSDIYLLRSICIYFDGSRREEHGAAKIMSLVFLVQKLFVKNHFRKLMTHNGFTGIDSNQLTTQNGFLKLDSNRLTTQKASRILWIKSTHDSKNFPRFWFKSTHDSKNWNIDLNRVMTQWLESTVYFVDLFWGFHLISLTFFGLSLNLVHLFWAFTQFCWLFWELN